jgi:hypothetical protein
MASCRSENNNNAARIPDATLQKVVPIDTNIAKVFVSADEKILVNGKESSLGELEVDLKRLPANGMVYYSRANASQEPSTTAMKVVDVIAKRSLPIQFYTDNTFTEVVKLK